MNCPLTQNLTTIKRLICATTGLSLFGTLSYSTNYCYNYYTNNKVKSENTKEITNQNRFKSFVAKINDDYPKFTIGITGSVSLSCIFGGLYISKEYFQQIKIDKSCCSIIKSSMIFPAGIMLSIYTTILYFNIARDRYSQYVKEDTKKV